MRFDVNCWLIVIGQFRECPEFLERVGSLRAGMCLPRSLKIFLDLERIITPATTSIVDGCRNMLVICGDNVSCNLCSARASTRNGDPRNAVSDEESRANDPRS